MNKDNRLLYVLVLIRVLLPYILQSSVYEPQRDEMLYLAEGNHLAFGFMEVPPMLSLFGWLTQHLGNSMFWIKFWPSLFGAATMFVCGKIVQSIGGKSFAIFILFLSFITSAYLRVFFLFQPNPPEIFFCTMIAYGMIRFVQTVNNKWLYVFGVSVGLGMLSKYSVAYFTSGALLGLLLTNQRRIFSNNHFWFAAVIALLIFLPTIIWEILHHLPIVHHMRELRERQLQFVRPADFLIDQFIMNLAATGVWFTGLWFLFVNKASKNYRFIAITYVLVILILLIFHGKNYYTLGLYPVLFAFGAYRIEQITVLRFRWARMIIPFCMITIGICLLPIQFPIFRPEKLASLYQKMHAEKSGALRWEDQHNHPLPQDFADMLGWEEMAQKMGKTYQTLSPEEKKHTILFCDNYGQAGALNFYAKKYNLPEAYSENASFLYWMPDSLHFENWIYLSQDPDEMKDPWLNHFSSVILCDSITNIYAREHRDKIILLKGAKPGLNEEFRQEVREKKARL
jgi:hypothetical protein